MCNQVKSVTLQTAVLIQVKEFAQNNQKFSIHDITRTIREKTSKDELEIPEVEVVVGDHGAPTPPHRFEISHAKVKSLFDELWRTGVFDPEFILDRSFTGMYFEYTPKLVGNVLAAPCPVNVPVPSVPYTATVPVPPIPVVLGKVSGSYPAICNRIETYLTNCKGRNFRPTLKQVQSAIKRDDYSTGWTCEKIQEHVESIGYKVIADPDAISRAQVATV